MYNLILYMHTNPRFIRGFCFNYLKIGYDVFKHCF